MEDSESDYNPSETSSVVAITASLCENRAAAMATTDIDSSSDDDSEIFPRPSTSTSIRPQKRSAPQPIAREDSSLSHLTPLNSHGLSKRQKTMVKEMREQHKKEQAAKRKEAQEARHAAREAKQPEVKLRSWSVTLAFLGQDIPAQRLQEWESFVLRQIRGISAAERGGTCNNRHAQSAIERMSGGIRTLRRDILKDLGWDVNPPTETFKLVLREIDGSKGLYESFDAFTGYVQKDSGLYPDWSIVHTDSVTPDTLTTGTLSRLWLSFHDLFFVFVVVVSHFIFTWHFWRLFCCFWCQTNFSSAKVSFLGFGFFRSRCLLRHRSRR